ncbi:MAG: hypothetical protein AMXMBFR53_32430 [Gemmatimonadota bacterium]
MRTLVVAATLALLAAPAAAQVPPAPAPRGWIGVSFEVTTTSQGGVARTVTRVTDVLEGSPAARAGVLSGDVIVSINGRDWAQDLPSATHDLRPGDAVRLVVERDGRRREIRVTAGERPVQQRVTLPSWSFTVTADSMAEYLYKAMDSLRVRITEGNASFRVLGERGVGGDSLIWVVGPDRSMVVRLRETEPSTGWVRVAPFDTPRPGAVAGVVVPEVRPPFEFFLFRGETHDSLRAEMDRLNREIRDLRSRQAARVQELARSARGEPARIDRNDVELLRLATELERAGARADALRAAMEAASHREASEHVSGVAPRTAVAAGEEAEVGLRPLAPYVLGQNRAAGAQVVDLRPELAAYFQVEGGVLVVDVPPGTLAHSAGMEPGDVLTRVDGTPVRSIADLRRALATPVPEQTVTLVRKGRTIQVLLRR